MTEKKHTPICRHFGTCGGCSQQHLPEAEYLAHKRGLVQKAFDEADIEIVTSDIVAFPPRSRRRVTFTAKRDGGNISVGFQERRSHELVNISECAVALPEILETLADLRSFAATLLQGIATAQFSVTACANGYDLNIALDESPSETVTADLVRLLSRSTFIRSSINGEVVFEREKPLVSFDNIPVVLPPTGFVQAVEDAEREMASLVIAHLKKSKRVADLFAGCGTFALRLARNSRVHAVEAFSPAVQSLKSASGASGLKSIDVETRDLFELPLTAAELSSFDGLCLDPPRAGAVAQVKEIAKSTIPRIAYVSCNPESLARDARHLIRGGHRLEQVVPVDQFVFSDHVEAVALFSKQPQKAKRSIFR